MKQNVKMILWIWKVKKRWRSFWSVKCQCEATLLEILHCERTIHSLKWQQWLLTTFPNRIIIWFWRLLNAQIWEKTLIHQHFYFHRCKYLSRRLIINSPRHDVIGHAIWRIKSFFVCHQSFLKENTYCQNGTVIN